MDRTDASFRIFSYKFLPRSMIPEFKGFPYRADDLVKASPSVPLKKARVALLTSGGLYLKDRQSSFDLDRERQEPFWGDPTYRLIPRDVRHGEIAVAHLHLNPDDILTDFNVALPLEVFTELEREERLAR
jgi:D-proline reductase (dithiol) PrdB